MPPSRAPARARGRARARTGWLASFAGALLLLLPATPFALSPQRPVRDFSIDTWSTKDGLPHNLIQSIAQTPDGYLWFGTWEGLVRFNGREFRVFDRANVPELPDNGVRAIAVARDGSLWLGTSRGGVVHRHGREWTVYDVDDGLPSDEITDLLEARDGRIWIATESHGLAVLEPGGRVLAINELGGLTSDGLIALAEDGDGGIWVGSARGAARVGPDGRIARYGAAEGLPSGAVFSIALDNAGRVLLGTETGPYRVEGARAIALAPGRKELLDNIPRMLQDRSGNLWVGTVNHGLARLHGADVQNLTLEDGMPNSRVSAIFEDREGSLWVGTNGGLMRLKDAPFTTYTTQKGLVDNYVRAVTEDASGTQWMATSRGLAYLRDGKFGALTAADGLSSDSLLSLLVASDGTLWVGSYGAGLSALRDGAITNVGTEQGLPGSQVRALAETPDGAIWVGTSRGLGRLAGGEVRRYGVAEGLPRNYILSLFVDRSGTLWVGTANGLARIVDGRVDTLGEAARFGVQDVFGFYQDARGSVWVATDRGVLRHRDGTFKQVSIAQGLPRETVFQIVPDAGGFLWMSSNRGIFRVALSELDAVADGRVARVLGTVYGEPDGMASAQCNGGSQPSAWRGRDGALWFATARGVAMVRPDQLRQGDRSPPPIVIEEIWADERELPVASRIVLAPGTRKVELRYAGLTFLLPETVRYRYRLEGFDPAWVETRRTHAAQYTNLAPGSYRFRVSAAHAGGRFNERESVVAIELRPHAWQTRWFALLVAAAALAVLGALYKLRTLRLRRSAKELSRQVQARTRDLEMQTQRLVDADEEKSRLLDRLREQSEAFELQARSDSLTGLPNRRHFDALFATEFARCRRVHLPITAVLIDVDLFKRINDRFSHAVGDEVLRVLSQMLREATTGRGLVSRYGGEEFALVFPGVPATEAAGICEGLRASVEHRDFAGAHPELRVTVSIGLSDRADAMNHERLLAFADAKLYEAKHAGRNCVVW